MCNEALIVAGQACLLCCVLGFVWDWFYGLFWIFVSLLRCTAK